MRKVIIDRSDKYDDNHVIFSEVDGEISVHIRIEAVAIGGNFPALSEIVLDADEVRALRRFFAPRWLRWLL